MYVCIFMQNIYHGLIYAQLVRCRSGIERTPVALLPPKRNAKGISKIQTKTPSSSHPLPSQPSSLPIQRKAKQTPPPQHHPLSSPQLNILVLNQVSNLLNPPCAGLARYSLVLGAFSEEPAARPWIGREASLDSLYPSYGLAASFSFILLLHLLLSFLAPFFRSV